MIKWLGMIVAFIVGVGTCGGVVFLFTIAVMVWAYLHAEEAPPGMAELEWRAKR